MTTSLDQLKKTGTVVVVDSGDFESTMHLPLFLNYADRPLQRLTCTNPR